MMETPQHTGAFQSQSIEWISQPDPSPRLRGRPSRSEILATISDPHHPTPVTQSGACGDGPEVRSRPRVHCDIVNHQRECVVGRLLQLDQLRRMTAAVGADLEDG